MLFAPYVYITIDLHGLRDSARHYQLARPTIDSLIIGVLLSLDCREEIGCIASVVVEEVDERGKLGLYPLELLLTEAMQVLVVGRGFTRLVELRLHSFGFLAHQKFDFALEYSAVDVLTSE